MAGADDDFVVAVGPESGKFWSDGGGSAQDPKCIVGGDTGADRGSWELADGSAKKMGAEVTGTVVPVSEVGPRPDSG